MCVWLRDSRFLTFCSKAWFIHVAAGPRATPPLGHGDWLFGDKTQQRWTWYILCFPPFSCIKKRQCPFWLVIWFSCMPAHSKWVHRFGYICIYFSWQRSCNIKQSLLISCKRQWRISAYLAVSVYPSLLKQPFVQLEWLLGALFFISF